MKNLFCRIKKIPVALVSFAFAGSVFLCSCNTVKTPEPVITEDEPVVEEVAEVVSEPEVVVEEVAEVVEEPEEEYVPTAKDLSPYKEITLDGVAENHFVTDDFCYIESEKYVVFLEKDVDVPGDFIVNVDAIVDELEKQLNVSATPEDYPYYDVMDQSGYYGTENPWEGWNIGAKIPIFLITDEEDIGYISCACADYLVIADYAMYSEDVWNSVPTYYASDFRVRPDYVDYSVVAHEMTHTITSRYNDMTEIMTEGIADYMARTVIDSLADDYPSIAICQKEAYLYDNPLPEKVNAGNAEAVFINDYHDIDHADRGAEYTCGRYLCQYLDETFGDDFYSKYKDQINLDGIDYAYGNYDEEITTAYANALKEVFGDDVFTKFGDWCVENHALQELGGVWPDWE